MIYRLLLLILYGAGIYGIIRYFAPHVPAYNSENYVGFLSRVGHALVLMWAPVLWFSLAYGLLWADLAPVSVPSLLATLMPFLTALFSFAIFSLLLAEAPRSAGGVLNQEVLGFPVRKWLAVLVMVVLLLLLLATSYVLWFARQAPALRLSLPQFILWWLPIYIPVFLLMALTIGLVGDIIPLEEDTPHRRRAASRMLTGFFTTYPRPTWVIEDEGIKNRVPGNPFYGSGPGWLLTEPENVVFLKTGYAITRMVGPGAVLTNRAESPYKVVDLRNQIRIARVNAVTRDGIEIRSPISSLFKIDRGNQEPALGQPWPYRNFRTVFAAVNAAEVDPADKSPLQAHQVDRWDELPLKIATHKVKQALTFYSLDDLYQDGRAAKMQQTHRRVAAALGIDPQTVSGEPLTRLTIGKMVREAVRQELEPQGFNIIGGSIGNRIVPLNESVTKQRVAAWKARWESQLMEWQAELQLQRYEDITRIQRSTTHELLSGLIEGTHERLRGLEEADSEQFSSNLVAYHLLNKLIQIAHAPQVQELLGESVLPTLANMQSNLEEERPRE